MTDKLPQFRRNPPPFSASEGLDAIAAGLNAVKRGQSDAVLADPLFKSPDRVREYRLGNSEMGALTFLRAMGAWGDVFAGPALALIGQRGVVLDAAPVSPVPVSGLLHKLVVALADGNISPRELAEMGGELDAAGRVIDALRARRADMVR